MSSDISSPYIIGIPVSGSSFFGRENQLKQFFNMLSSQTLQPMRVMGLRRSGKTSFLRHASTCNEARKLLNRENHRTVIAYVDLQMGITDINAFCEGVINAIHKVIPSECKLPTEVKGLKTLSSWLEVIFDENLRCVVFLDEYEALTDVSRHKFDVSFFQYLRAICSGDLLSNFIWVTCSNFELSVNSPQEREHDKSSPFENIFHTKPIIIGGLSHDELRKLINEPLVKDSISFSLKEINTIESIAGTLPYFVQAVAHEWFLIKKHVTSTKRLSKTIIGTLIYPNSRMDRLFWDYWNVFTTEERNCLLGVFREKSFKRSHTHSEIKFLDYGLLNEEEESLSFNGKLFNNWILNNLHNLDIRGESSMIETDINRLKIRIEENKESINDLEGRVSNLKTARAKLNKTTQVIEYDSYTEQITEIATTIDDFNNEVYSKRNELLLLTFGENDFPELITKINERLSHLSTEQVNDLFPHIVQLQMAIESAGVLVPSQLIGTKKRAKNKGSSDEEKRTKVKLTLSLLGPKVEIEKTIADSNVRNVLNNVWKKVKEIVLKEES